MVNRSDWTGLVSGRRRASADVELELPLRDSGAGGSGAFLGRANDGRRYWIKTLNNYQGERVPITEQIVGRAGALIRAATCEVKTVTIPAELSGWKFRGDRQLEAGIAHGSVHVEGSVETRTLEFRSLDENRLRHCSILALYDWCWGSDVQWLRVEHEDQRYYSHDHGWYLPPSGPSWDVSELTHRADEPHEFPDSWLGFDMWSPIDVATRLTAITRSQLIDVLSEIPSDWPVKDEELESVGFFLERRASQVAARLRQRQGATP